MKFSRSRRAPPTPELTPLIDVVFLLLIFFAVSTSFVTSQGIRVDLPRAAPQDSIDEDQSIRISIDQGGAIFIDDTPMDMDSLKARLTIAARQDPPPVVVIRADQEVSHGLVVRIMDLAQRTGLRHLAVATEPQ